MPQSIENSYYLSILLTIDKDGALVARTGTPEKPENPEIDLGPVSGMTLGVEEVNKKETFVVTGLAVAVCPAGKCWKKVNGRWGCYPC
jgi:hypothetical protein